MLGYGLLVVVEVVLVVYCFLDALTSPRGTARVLPKPLWLGVIVVLPVLGSIAWLVFGKPPRGAVGRPRPVAPSGGPDDDEAFLRDLRDRERERQRRSRDPRDDQRPRRSALTAAAAAVVAVVAVAAVLATIYLSMGTYRRVGPGGR